CRGRAPGRWRGPRACASSGRPRSLPGRGGGGDGDAYSCPPPIERLSRERLRGDTGPQEGGKELDGAVAAEVQHSPARRDVDALRSGGRVTVAVLHGRDGLFSHREFPVMSRTTPETS